MDIQLSYLLIKKKFKSEIQVGHFTIYFGCKVPKWSNKMPILYVLLDMFYDSFDTQNLVHL